jgi:SAM-dependent methyltransferase
MTTTTFDQFARRYDAALNEGLAATGESREFFARRRVEWLRDRLHELATRPRTVMDFGCGVGATSGILREVLEAEVVFGVDISRESLDVARDRCSDQAVTFFMPDEWPRGLEVDLVYCNGVFHHIDPMERPACLSFIHRALGPDGVFALWENNPWNPGTRLVMSRIPFDRDAQLMTSGDAVKLLVEQGFSPLRLDYTFVFPHLLRAFRRLEPRLSAWPIGGQYQVLMRRAERRPG